MEKKIETIEIVAKEVYGDKCLNDQVNSGSRNKNDGSPEGYVEIYEVDDDGNKKLVGKHNLVLYIGREWLAQRFVNINNANVASTKDQFLSWFGLGDGGVIPGDPLNPAPPTLLDTGLSNEVMITTGSTAGDPRVTPEVGNYKIPFDTVAFEQDVLNDDKWLVIKITTTVASEYANGKELSEAGLFAAESSLDGYGGPFIIFSKVTFPSIVKTSDRRLVFSWYLYV